jgi:hypothetical protein
VHDVLDPDDRHTLAVDASHERDHLGQLVVREPAGDLVQQ